MSTNPIRTESGGRAGRDLRGMGTTGPDQDDGLLVIRAVQASSQRNARSTTEQHQLSQRYLRSRRGRYRLRIDGMRAGPATGAEHAEEQSRMGRRVFSERRAGSDLYRAQPGAGHGSELLGSSDRDERRAKDPVPSADPFVHARQREGEVDCDSRVCIQEEHLRHEELTGHPCGKRVGG